MSGRAAAAAVVVPRAAKGGREDDRDVGKDRRRSLGLVAFGKFEVY